MSCARPFGGGYRGDCGSSGRDGLEARPDGSAVRVQGGMVFDANLAEAPPAVGAPLHRHVRVDRLRAVPAPIRLRGHRAREPVGRVVLEGRVVGQLGDEPFPPVPLGDGPSGPLLLLDGGRVRRGPAPSTPLGRSTGVRHLDPQRGVVDDLGERRPGRQPHNVRTEVPEGNDQSFGARYRGLSGDAMPLVAAWDTKCRTAGAVGAPPGRFDQSGPNRQL